MMNSFFVLQQQFPSWQLPKRSQRWFVRLTGYHKSWVWPWVDTRGGWSDYRTSMFGSWESLGKKICWEKKVEKTARDGRYSRWILSQGFFDNYTSFQGARGALAESFQGWWINGSCSGIFWDYDRGLESHTSRKNLEFGKMKQGIYHFMMWSAIDYIIINIYYIDKYDPTLYRWFEQCHSKDGFWDE